MRSIAVFSTVGVTVTVKVVFSSNWSKFLISLVLSNFELFQRGAWVLFEPIEASLYHFLDDLLVIVLESHVHLVILKESLEVIKVLLECVFGIDSLNVHFILSLVFLSFFVQLLNLVG